MDPHRFVVVLDKLGRDLAERAGTLGASFDASGHKDWKAAFQKVTDACKSCHKSFRAESEHGGH